MIDTQIFEGMHSGVNSTVFIFLVASPVSWLKKINKIIWPLVKKEIIKFFKEHSKGIVAVEVPLLFESKMDNLFDVIIGVEAPEKVQLKLLSSREGNKSEQLKKINTEHQYDKNKNKADFIISNDVDLKSLINKTDKLINKLRDRLD